MKSKVKSTDSNSSSEGSYDVHARRLHSAARKTHAQWISSMSPQMRRKLQQMGLDSAPDDNSEVGGHSPYSLSDIADSPLAKCEASMQPEEADEILADQFGLTKPQASAILAWHRKETEASIEQEKANYLQIIVGGLLSSKNPKLNSAGLAFAANLAALNGLPCQREFARRNHISASAISKVVRHWTKALDLRPSAHQKTNEACEVYSRVGKSDHWRSRKVSSVSAAALFRKIQNRQASQN